MHGLPARTSSPHARAGSTAGQERPAHAGPVWRHGRNYRSPLIAFLSRRSQVGRNETSKMSFSLSRKGKGKERARSRSSTPTNDAGSSSGGAGRSSLPPAKALKLDDATVLKKASEQVTAMKEKLQNDNVLEYFGVTGDLETDTDPWRAATTTPRLGGEEEGRRRLPCIACPRVPRPLHCVHAPRDPRHRHDPGQRAR